MNTAVVSSEVFIIVPSQFDGKKERERERERETEGEGEGEGR